MSLQLQATKHQLVDIKRIVGIGADRLAAVRAKLRDVQLSTLHPQELLDAVGEVVSPDEAESLVRQLLSLHGIVRQSGTSIEKVVAGIRAAIERQGPEAGITLDAWTGIEGSLAKLIDERCVRLAATAIELAYDYANLLRRTKILTDIRPIYNQAGNDIEGAVVSYTLRLRYDSADGEHELSIALDDNDINELSEECARAVSKAHTAKAFMGERGIPVAIFGQVNDA